MKAETLSIPFSNSELMCEETFMRCPSCVIDTKPTGDEGLKAIGRVFTAQVCKLEPISLARNELLFYDEGGSGCKVSDAIIHL